MAVNKIYLTKDGLTKLLNSKKKVGQGTEGYCLKFGREVYKIYIKPKEEIVYTSSSNSVDDNGVKVFDKNEYREARKIIKDNRIIRYTAEDGTKVNVEQALHKVIDKGQKVVGSKLPTKIIYVDGVARGCVYPYYAFSSSIYTAVNKSFNTRLNICKKLLEKVKELVSNNIYPVDLSQKNPDNPFDKSYSNVLLTLRNEPVIIDLDGKSALYTEVYDERLERIASITLADLLLELLSREELNVYIQDGDYDSIESILSNLGISDDLISKYIDRSLFFNDLDTIITQVESRGKKR